MFCFLEGDGVEREINDAFVVGGHACGAVKWKMKIKKKVAEE